MLQAAVSLCTAFEWRANSCTALSVLLGLIRADLSFGKAFNKPIYNLGRHHPEPGFMASRGGRVGPLRREEVKLYRALYIDFKH